MGMGLPPMVGEEASKAMLEGLISRIRAGLRERIMASIEPEIEAAITAAIDGLKVAIESYRDNFGARDVVHILVERRTGVDKPSEKTPNQARS